MSGLFQMLPLWRQKSVGSESERQVQAVLFILGCTVSRDFNNVGLKVPQLILHHENIGSTNFNKRITVSFTLFQMTLPLIKCCVFIGQWSVYSLHLYFEHKMASVRIGNNFPGSNHVSPCHPGYLRYCRALTRYLTRSLPSVPRLSGAGHHHHTSATTITSVSRHGTRLWPF